MTQILKSISDVQAFRKAHDDKTLGFVPTMGNLHEGHISLMEISQNHTDITLASIFVNPTQFGPNEDLDAYPRTFDADLEKLAAANVDAVFFPDEKTIYPHSKDNTLSIEMPNSMTSILCGIGRPTHFQGVATVVAKLFQIVKPNVAVFGEKDFQQLALIRRLNEELFMNIEILAGAIKRERDGLAMSSRNQYLNNTDRQRSVWLSKTLKTSRERIITGEDPNVVIDDGIKTLASQHIDVEYLDFRDVTTLSQQPKVERGVLLVAGRLGRTRLIDNLRIVES